MNRTLRVLASSVTALALLHAAPAPGGTAEGQSGPPDDFRVRDIEASPPGGIAGVGYSENFESGYDYGPLPGPFGDVEIIDHPDPTFGAYSLMDQANGSGQGVQEYRSPVFALETGGIYTDLIISDATSLFQFITVNATTGFFNTRVSFEANGTIRALQISGAPPCTTGIFAITTGTWTPGVKMRIGVEVLAAPGGGILRVYKDGVHIFQGHDISQFCAAGNPAIGMSQIRNFNSNVGTTASFVIDNISNQAIHNACLDPLPFCAADVFPADGDDLVNLDDLLTVINSWGQNGQPVGPRPAGDCAPGSLGDCVVNLDDILAVVNAWGSCPPITGACCIQGVCSTQTQAACTGSPNFGTYFGDLSQCASVNCPLPPLGDLCTSPMTAINGSNNWNNANANTDGPVPPASCFPNGGSVRGDVWFTHTATCTGNVIFDTIGTAAPFTDTYLQVFDGTSCSPIGPMLGCNDDINFGASNWLSRVSIPMTANQMVLIRCASNGSSPMNNSGAAILNISCQVPIGSCDDSGTLSIPSTTNGSIQGTASARSFPSCLPGGQPLGFGRWYRVIGNGHVLTASTCESPAGTGWDGQLVVFCGLECDALTCVAGSNSFNCGPGGQTGTGIHETVSWCSRPGFMYRIFVGGDQIPAPPEGSFTLTVTSGDPCETNETCGGEFSNDNCANAIAISNGTTTFSTVFATTDGTLNSPLPPGVDCNDSGGTQTSNDIWYRYTATCNGYLTISTCSQLGGTSNYDSDLVLYSGNASCPPPSSQIISCNDDDDDGNPCGAAPPWSSTLHASVTTGSTYLLRVGGFQDSTDFGTGVLSVTCGDQFCGNGILESPEQCDDANGVPNDGCTNCVIDAECSVPCNIVEDEACVEGPDTVNGGCNTTPALYTTIDLKSEQAVICGEAWATQIGQVGNRDLDWYAVTVGSSGRVEAHITATTLMPMLVFVGTATGPPGGGPCSGLVTTISDVALQGQCKVAVRTGLTSGSTALVIVAPNVFTGFPCSGGPWTYRLRIVSP